MLEELASRGFQPSMGQLVSQLMHWGLMPLGKRLHRPSSTESVHPVAIAHPDEPYGSTSSDGLHDKTRKPAEAGSEDSHLDSSAEEGKSSPSREKIPDRGVGCSVSTSTIAGSSSKNSTNEIRLDPPPACSEEEPISPFNFDSIPTQTNLNMLCSNLENLILRQKVEDQFSDAWQPTEENLNQWRCNCYLFITATQSSLRSAPVFYWNILHGHYSDQSIFRAIALVYIWYMTTAFTPEEDAKYRSLIRSSTKAYLKLATRRHFLNPIVCDLAQELAKIYAVLHEDNQELSVTWPRSYNTGKKQIVPLKERLEIWFGELIICIPNQIDFQVLYDTLNVSFQCSQEKNGKIMFKVAGKSRDILLANNIPLRKYLSSKGTIDLFKVSEAALEVAKILLPYELTLRSIAGSKIVESELVTMIDAIGVVVARELAMILKQRHEYSLQTMEDDPPAAIVSTAIQCLPEEGRSVFTSLKIRQQSWSLRRLLDAYDLCDLAPPNALKPDPGYHSLHKGPCPFERIWRFLDSDIKNFDLKLQWVDRLLVRQKWPQLQELEGSDTMSIRTSSSDNSLSRFQALAIRIRFRDSMSSVDSLRSNWSGHMSEDSWRLNDIMEIG